MQQLQYPGTLQRDQHHQNPSYGPQGQGQQITEKWPHINCLEEYTGESGRSFGGHLEEHLRAPSPIHQHSHSTGYPVSPDCFTIVNRNHRESPGI